MKFVIFLKNCFYLLAVFAIFLTFLMLTGLLGKEVLAAWIGLSLAMMNFLMGAAVLSWGASRSDKDFYGSFLGGMIVRFALIFFILWICIKYFQLNTLVLISSLLISYSAFLFLEIWLIHKHSLTKGSRS